MAYQPNYYYQPYYQQNTVPDMLNQYKYPQQQMPMQQQPMQMQATQQTSQNDIIWVQGEAGAKAYLVAPNTTVTLWDSENQTIYLKTADASGVPSMRILDWQERTSKAHTPTEKHECKCGKEFVRVEDFNALKEKLEALEKKMEMAQEKPKKNTKVKEDVENG